MPGTVVAENLARDPQIVQRVKDEWLPLTKVVREDRLQQRETWLRYHRIWGVKRDFSGYEGRTKTYLPIGRKVIENWVRRIKRDLFPDTDWYDIRALRESFERRVPANKAIQGYFFRKQMRLRRSSSPWLRQLVTLGTSPVRHVWRIDERTQRILRDVLDESEQPTGRWEQKVETLVDYLGPTFRPVDLHAFYVWPTTVTDVEDATLAFEDLLVSRDRIEMLGKKPLDPRNAKLGHVYENVPELMRFLGEQFEMRPGGVGTNTEKFEAQKRRLADKGFTHPVDQRLPASMRPADVAESIWRVDLGEGVKRYLVAMACDEVVLRVQENPFWHGGMLWLVGKLVEVLGEFYGRGLPEVFEWLQYLANDIAEQSGDALVWSTNPIAVVDAYGVQDPDSLRMAPGAKWLAARNSVQFIEPPQGPAQAGFNAVGMVLGLANEFANVTPAGAVGSAQRGRSRSQQTAAGMQIMVAEGAVDIREVVENLEDQVMEPMLRRNHLLAQQFLTKPVILRLTGVDGATMIDTPVSVGDLLGDYEFEWLGSMAAANQQVRSMQQIQFLALVSKIPPQMLEAEGIKIGLKFLLRDIYGTGLGLRNAERVVADVVRPYSVDWRLENDLFRAGMGAEVFVSERDNHAEHARGHDLVLGDPNLPASVAQQVRAHIEAHVTAGIMQQMSQQQGGLLQALRGMGPGGGGAPPGPNGNGMGPPPGGMPGGPGRLPQTTSLDDLFRRLPREALAPG